MSSGNKDNAPTELVGPEQGEKKHRVQMKGSKNITQQNDRIVENDYMNRPMVVGQVD